MSLHSSMSYPAMEARRNRDQSSGEPRTLRQELNSAYTAYMVKARAVRGSRKPADVALFKRAEASMADLQEQLTLLDAIEFGFIKPVLGQEAS